MVSPDEAWLPGGNSQQLLLESKLPGGGAPRLPQACCFETIPARFPATAAQL